MARRKLQVRAGIGALLTRLRQQHNPPLSQAQAAELVGANVRNWGNWEREHTAPDLSSIIKIADAFNITPQDFLQPVPTEDTTTPTRADVLRLERKVDLLLDHFDVLPADAAMPGAPSEITALEQPQPKRKRRRRS